MFMKIFLFSRAQALVALLTVGTMLAIPLRAQVVINEVMANNRSAVQNEGIYPDWVELHNPTGDAVNISDWSISDSILTPRKFIFPAGTIIPAGGFLIVWCDGVTNPAALRTGFTLNGTIDDVSIYGSISMGGGQQDRVAWGLQIADLSISRVPDGTGAWNLTLPTAGGPNAAALPLGSTTNLKINEVMPNPQGGEDWFELYNPETNYVHLGGLVFSDRLTTPATNKAIAQLSFIAPGEFIQFIADDTDSDPDHVAFKLGNSGDNLTLFAVNRTTVIHQMNYTGTQTNGVSFGLLPDGSTNRVYFPAGRSSPGASNFQLLSEVVINEVLTHTDPPLEDAVEFYNPWPTNVNMGGWWLSNSRDDPKKFRFPANTIVPAGGYFVVYENPGSILGFNSNGFGTNRSFTFNAAHGDQVYLHQADAAGNILPYRASRDFGPAANGVSFGRWVTSDGGSDLVAMSRRSFGVDNPTSLPNFRQGTGLTNPYPLVGPLVINEIMYHPPDILTPSNTMVDNTLDEYIEIHNPGTTNVLLYDPNIYRITTNNAIFAYGFTNTWRIRGGVDFNFPTNVSLAPGGYLLVVNFNPTTNTTQLDAFRATYSVPTNVQIFGPYTGGDLDNGGGTIDLLKPDPPQSPEFHPEEGGFVPYVRVEKVEYNDRAPWPTEPDAMGAALQRVHALGYGNDATNWIAAGASPGAVFIPNSPPNIAPIPDLTTNELRRIEFLITATDTNLPAQSLTYSLEPGAPAGATIDATGLFRWRPREEDGEVPPRPFPITVRVTDNGTPPRSSTRTFTINVREVNRPPSFRIREQWVKEGTQLTFLTGSDPDIPFQFVTYRVAGTAPAGLTVNSDTGEVTWTPAAGQASTNAYRVTIEGTDDGEPNLTGRFTYTIHVLGANETLVWPDIRWVGNEVIIEWRATLGKTYRVEYTDGLAPTNWSLLYDFLEPQNEMMSVTDFLFYPQRIYRVIQLD
jgi:hypothetical protein